MAEAGEAVRFAPAKINLYLHVTGRRPDGYHELDSLVAFADVGDRVTVRPGAAPDLAVTGPFAPALAGDGDNLVLRAARLFGSEWKVGIVLEKNLPVASGLGGGSSDAAATLLALNDLYPGSPDLARMALSLGADVPACLRGEPLWLGGIGDRLEVGPALPTAQLVLVNPAVPLATPAVFAAYRAGAGPFSTPMRRPARFDNAHVLAAFLREARNDLEASARFMAPAVDTALAALANQPGCLLARMSGSGATCFGLFPTPLSAQRAVQQIARAEPDWWAVATTWRTAP
jgi:4-diphosphocytidyl-2-C-methyl-D-erythritol kinase